MPRERSETQAVDAFSAPRDLLRSAHLLAKKRRMTKSGFYRYCLAKEVGYSEPDALRIAEHASIGTFQIIQNTGSGDQHISGEGAARRKVKFSRKKKGKKK